jgi:serine/threonine protein kinase
MAHAPPRPAPPAAGSPGGPGSQTGTRNKDQNKNAGTFFLGGYRVVDEIGVGGMASVHLARMDGPGGFQKWVAIKRIHPHLVEDDQFVDMFLDEARIAAGISHSNVATVFQLGKDDNTYWIAMEYLHGEPLREIMRRAEETARFVPTDLAARICADAAEGLHAAHELRGKNGQLLGLVHRDVTPHNLFLTYDGYTKVVDFGIAKVQDRLASTRAGTLKGKLAYMSPEQVRGQEVDRRTDVFALGVVLWELTTNHRLFRMDTDLDTLEKVQACIVPPPSTIVPDYPVELESVVMKALAKNRNERFQTARDFSRALQSFLVRRGTLIGPEEVSNYMRAMFQDRIQKREAHLHWASEVTSTVNVDALRAQASDEPSIGYSDKDQLGVTGQGRAVKKPERPAAPPPAAPPSLPSMQAQSGGPMQSAMASMSLLDDDEDIPTAVATRSHMESANRALAGAPQRAAPPPPKQDLASTTAMPSGQRPNYPAQPGRPPMPPPDERTSALPSGSYPGEVEDLGATLALPSAPSSSSAPLPAAGRIQPTMRSVDRPNLSPPPGFGQGYGQAPQGFGPGAQGPGFPGQPQQQQYHPQQQQPQQQQPQQQQPQQQQHGFGFGQGNGQQGFGQQPGMHGGQMGMGTPGPRMPQSQVETALSLPRPDPAALWLAQQEASARPQKKGSGVLILVGVLAALCVIGLGVLVYLKVRGPTAGATAVSPETSAAAPVASASAAPVASASAAPPEASAAAAPSASPDASAKAASTSAPASGGTPAKAAGAATAATTAAPKAKEEPGFLTIVCTPFCDDVVDQGRSLGPSPVVRVSVAPGQHRITLKRSGQTDKVISVIVVSGQVTAQRVSMK